MAASGGGHAIDERDHRVPGLHRAVREKQIDDHARFGIRNGTQSLFHLAHGVGALLARDGELVLHLLRVAHTLAEDIGLQPLGVGEPVDELEHRAVGMGLSRLLQAIREGPSRHLDDVRRARRRQLVRERAQRRHVERQLAAALREDEDRAPLAHGVPQAELVEHVRVGRRQVGHRVVAQDQPLEHRLVDDAAGHLLVGAQGLHVGLRDRGRDELLVHAVEVHGAAGRVGLAAEGHEHEAERASHAAILSPHIVAASPR